MEFFDVVRSRHSVRRYSDHLVEEEKLNAILDVVNSAPSAGDIQGYEVVVISDLETKAALSRASYGQTSLTEAPVCLVFCADEVLSASKYGQRGVDLYSVQDATIAAAYAQLAATDLGLATVWVGAFDTAAVAAVVETPDQVVPVAIIPIGYAAETPRATPRRDLGDLVRVGKY